MRLALTRTGILAVLIVTAAAVTAEAQGNWRPGDFGSARFRLGLFEPEGDSAYWDDTFSVFTGAAGDFQDLTIGLDYLWRTSARTGIQFGTSFYGGETTQAYLDYVDLDGWDISHVTSLDTWDVSAAYVVRFGDGGSAGDPGDRAQSTSVLLGKILRIDPQGDDLPADPDRNYSIPPDNPFVGAAGEDEIWALGLRNPWRFSFDRSTGDLFVGDVGQNAWEEIDHQPAGSDGGENYGWRCYEGNHPYNTAGCGGPSQYTAPIAEYSHGDGCSVTGGHRYRGASYPNLQGTYLYADYCSGTIWGAAPAGSGWSSAPLLESSMTISSFGQDEAGELYLADHGSNGAVYRIVDSSPTNLVFADGFESGDATAWSGVAPRRAAAGRRPQ